MTGVRGSPAFGVFNWLVSAVNTMVSIAPEWMAQECATNGDLTVLVVEPGAERLVAVGDELTRRGFVVIPVTSWSAAMSMMALHPVHIGVVHGDLADVASLAQVHAGDPRSAGGSGNSSEIPFIFTIEDPLKFDWHSYALLGSADYLLAPVPPVQLGWRVGALASRLKRRAIADLEADQLRTAVRRVSEAIQSTTEPAAMGALLVSGAVDVFDLPHVRFMTFDDERVPRLGFQCQNTHPLPRPLDLDDEEESIKALAARLWRAGDAADLTSQRCADAPDGYPELALAHGAAGDHASLALPLGNGSSAFGLLWLSFAGEPRLLSAMEVSLLRHLTGVAAQALLQAQIITGQQEVLKRLQRLDDAKSNFLRTVNHELRTPLTSMSAYLDLIRDGAGGELPSAAVKMLSIVERNARRLTMLVDDVLTISRMSADPQVIWDPVNIPQLVTGVAGALDYAAVAKGVRLEVKESARDLVVQGDATRLRQVFRNIADNAIKFTPTGGRVEITVGSCVLDGSVDAISVSVADNGNGVAEEDLPELFTRFFRGANAEADAVAGSGLGLAIARGVVDSHGGTIGVSRTAGGGTTILVQLPVHRQPAPQAA